MSLPASQPTSLAHTDLRSCYVYYKIRPEYAGQIRSQLGAMQQRLQAQFALHCGLQQRADDSSTDSADRAEIAALPTWMEIYHETARSAKLMQGVSLPQLLQQEFATELGHAPCLNQWIEGARHIECFKEVPCA